LGFYERKKEVVAFADDHSLAVYRGLDRHVERIGGCPIYLYTVLNKESL